MLPSDTIGICWLAGLSNRIGITIGARCVYPKGYPAAPQARRKFEHFASCAAEIRLLSSGLRPLSRPLLSTTLRSALAGGRPGDARLRIPPSFWETHKLGGILSKGVFLGVTPLMALGIKMLG